MNHSTDEAERMMLYLNDGVYASFNCLLYDHQIVKPILLKKSNQHEKKIKSTIFGPTCDALDEIINDIELPMNTDVGDFMFFENMGAYTLPVASPFNGFPLPKIFYYIDRALLEEWFVLPIDGEDYVQDFIGKTIDSISVWNLYKLSCELLKIISKILFTFWLKFPKNDVKFFKIFEVF